MRGESETGYCKVNKYLDFKPKVDIGRLSDHVGMIYPLQVRNTLLCILASK